MNKRDGARQVGIAEIPVECLQLVRPQHPLVDDGPRRERREIAVVPGRHRAQRRLDLATDDVKRNLEGRSGIDLAIDEHPRHVDLADDGTRPPRRRGQNSIVHGHVTPTQDRVAFLGNGLLDHPLAPAALGRARGEKDHPYSIAPGLGQRDTGEPTGAPQENVGDLEQDSRAIAGAGVGGDCATVRKILQQLQRLLDDVARADAVDVRDETDATRVVLVSGVVQSLLCGHRLSRSIAPVNPAQKKGLFQLGRGLCALSLQPAMSHLPHPRKFSPSPRD